MNTLTKRKWNHGVVRILPLFFICPMHALAADQLEPLFDQVCVSQLLQQAPADMTLAELRKTCSVAADDAGPLHDDLADVVSAASNDPDEDFAAVDVVEGSVEQRLEAESEAVLRPFSLMAHKPNYMLAGVYNSKGWADRQLAQSSPQTSSYEDIEAQFQVSIKVPLGIGLLNGRVDWYTAYTNRSFWQVFDHVDSEPFRETNHEPETWLQMKNDWSLFGFRNFINSVGIVHQSNGQSGDLSRTWNRIYGNFVFEKGDWALSFKPWIWIFEKYGQDENPNIDDYMGNGEFRVAYAHNGHVLTGMLRNQLESGFDQGAVELSWSFPVFDYPYLKGYVQYFNGYGESLIDYDRKVNRIGIGISITDWLH